MKIKPNARPEVVVKNAHNFKRPYAYDQFGNRWDLEKAIEVTPRKWFLDKSLKMPMTARFNGKKNKGNWALNSGVFEHNGNKFNTKNFNNESIEHINFKYKILKQCFFNWKGYKIQIIEASEEFRIYEGNMFRADVKASMLDGTPIFIEVVKTSEVSEKKENFINENEFTTFVIYIDNAGNQINNKFNIIGNKELVKLNERIQDGEGKIADVAIRIRKINHQRDTELRGLPDRAKKESGFNEDMLTEINRLEEENGELLRNIEQTRNEIKSIEPSYVEEIDDKLIVENERGTNNEQEIEHLKSRLEAGAIKIQKLADKIGAIRKRISYFKNKITQANSVSQRGGL